jgi:hypothetical protein
MQTPRGTSSLFRQPLVLVWRNRNDEFHLPEFNTKNVTVGGILKIGVIFWSNSTFQGEKLQPADNPRREEHFH